MNWKLFSILILNFNFIFSGVFIIKNDGAVKLLVIDPNSKFAITIDQNNIGKIDTSLIGFKKLFINETLDFFEEEQPNSQTFKLKYQLRDNDFTRKETAITYNQIKQFANKKNQEFVITAF